MIVLSQRDAPTIIRRGLRHLLPDYRFVSRTTTALDPQVQPYVTAISAGTPTGTVGVASENVHVTVYAGTEPMAREIAVVIDALLLNPAIEWGFSISPSAGLIVAPDDVTGGFLASITVMASSPKIERIL